MNAQAQSKAAYRHELKYPIDYAAYLSLSSRLKAVMKRDGHTNEDGKYTIRSIYFDNYRDTALREKIIGAKTREKFRIRYYNDDFSFITLEKKIKHDDLCLKLDATLLEEETRLLLRGDTDWMLKHDDPLIKELYIKMKTQQLRPRVLVSYTREPYVYAAGNVRVTFDSDIRSTLYHTDFLEASVTDISVGAGEKDASAPLLMELKYDGFLPSLIADLLQGSFYRQEAFSKYGACRRFG